VHQLTHLVVVHPINQVRLDLVSVEEDHYQTLLAAHLDSATHQARHGDDQDLQSLTEEEVDEVAEEVEGTMISTDDGLILGAEVRDVVGRGLEAEATREAVADLLHVVAEVEVIVAAIDAVKAHRLVDQEDLHADAVRAMTAIAVQEVGVAAETEAVGGDECVRRQAGESKKA
jgi:hypothetical protein